MSTQQRYLQTHLGISDSLLDTVKSVMKMENTQAQMSVQGKKTFVVTYIDQNGQTKTVSKIGKELKDVKRSLKNDRNVRRIVKVKPLMTNVHEEMDDDKDSKKKKDKDKDDEVGKSGKDSVEVEPDEKKDEKKERSYSEQLRLVLARRKRLDEKASDRPQDNTSGEKSPVKQGSSKVRDDGQDDDESNKFGADEGKLDRSSQKKKEQGAPVSEGFDRYLSAIRKEKDENKKLKLADQARKAGAKSSDIQKALSESLSLSEAAMTRQHFQQFADAISQIKDSSDKQKMASMAAQIFAASNPRFDKQRFMKACGI